MQVTDEAPRPMRPRLRGHFHQAAFFIALGAGVVLVAAAPTARATLAASIYAVTLALLFGISALYHRPWWPEKPRDVMARLDHAMIYLFIAGSNLPFSMLGLSAQSCQRVLIPLWGAAITLAVLRVVGRRMPRWLMSFGYVALGWAAAVSVPELARNVPTFVIVLLFVGGVIYTVGAVIFWRKWPNPSPRWLGYHEVFHLLVIAAAAVHFVAAASLIFSSR